MGTDQGFGQGLVLRERYDALLEHVRQVELEGLPAHRLVAGASECLGTLREALQVAVDLGGKGPSPWAANVLLEMASVTAHLGAGLADRERFVQALDQCDRGLRMLLSLETPAPLFEVKGLYVRGQILAALGDEAAGLAHLEEVVQVLGPHVARMREIRATGTEAERFAIELSDSRIRAEELLAGATATLEEMGVV